MRNHQPAFRHGGATVVGFDKIIDFLAGHLDEGQQIVVPRKRFVNLAVGDRAGGNIGADTATGFKGQVAIRIKHDGGLPSHGVADPFASGIVTTPRIFVRRPPLHDVVQQERGGRITDDLVQERTVGQRRGRVVGSLQVVYQRGHIGIRGDVRITHHVLGGTDIGTRAIHVQFADVLHVAGGLDEDGLVVEDLRLPGGVGPSVPVAGDGNFGHPHCPVIHDNGLGGRTVHADKALTNVGQQHDHIATVGGTEFLDIVRNVNFRGIGAAPITSHDVNNRSHARAHFRRAGGVPKNADLSAIDRDDYVGLEEGIVCAIAANIHRENRVSRILQVGDIG